MPDIPLVRITMVFVVKLHNFSVSWYPIAFLFPKAKTGLYLLNCIAEDPPGKTGLRTVLWLLGIVCSSNVGDSPVISARL